MKKITNPLKFIIASVGLLACCLLVYLRITVNASQGSLAIANKPHLITLKMPTDSIPSDVRVIEMAQPQFEAQKGKLRELHEKPEVSAMSNMDDSALKAHCKALQKNANVDAAVKDYANQVLEKINKMEARGADHYQNK